MFKMTQKIYDTLKKQEGLKVFTDETERSSYVWLQFGVKNGSNYRIRFISRDDDNDVAVRVYGLLSVAEEQRAKILSVINEINVEYRYVKFSLDNDGDVNLTYDYLVRCPDPAASAMEIVIRITDIIDEVYPKLMQALWA